jgi:hypothetical protein
MPAPTHPNDLRAGARRTRGSQGRRLALDRDCQAWLGLLDRNDLYGHAEQLAQLALRVGHSRKARRRSAERPIDREVEVAALACLADGD